ncbi:MAG: integrin alpha [Planctomycetes bacterium]|nr:integrin alpha [Planctomycetota bacterium]
MPTCVWRFDVPGSTAGSYRARGVAIVPGPEPGAESELAVFDGLGRGINFFSLRDGSLLRELSIAPPEGLQSVPFGELRNADGGPLLYCTVNSQFADPRRSGVDSSVAVIDLRTTQTLDVVHGDAPEDFFGFSVCNLGDLDGDRADDLAIGAPQCLRHPVRGCGAGYVDLYSVGRRQRLARLVASEWGGCFGWAVAAVADVNDDGVRDFAVGAPGTHHERGWCSGTLSLFSGRTFELIWSTRSARDYGGRFEPFDERPACYPSGGMFASRLVGELDFEGDGVPDVVALRPGIFGIADVRSGVDGRALFSYHDEPERADYCIAVCTWPPRDRSELPSSLVSISNRWDYEGGPDRGLLRISRRSCGAAERVESVLQPGRRFAGGLTSSRSSADRSVTFVAADYDDRVGIYELRD